MFKKAMLVVLAVVFMATTVFAMNFDGGDGRKGKRLWKRYHTKCADGTKLSAKAGAATRTQAQWKDAFTNPANSLIVTPYLFDIEYKVSLRRTL